ncbi:MAG: serine/threonine-protein phosphatase [Ruminococcus sp.]|nr:serine/threonine-protein phosphatase [Ruminococcus sp.]
MSERKKNKKLVFQVGLITVQIFTIAILIFAILVFYGTTNVYLSAKQDMIERDISRITDSLKGYQSLSWLLSYWRENPDKIKDEVIGEESALLTDLYDKGLQNVTLADLEKMTDAKKLAFARAVYKNIESYLDLEQSAFAYGHSYCIMVGKSNKAFLLFNGKKVNSQAYSRVSGSSIGEKWEYETDEHEGLKKLLNGSTKRFEYETATINGGDKEYYICTTPIMLSSNVKCVYCIAYDYSDYAKQLASFVRKSTIIGFLGLSAMGVLMLVFIYLVSIKPLKRVIYNVREYMVDKDSKKIVGNLKKIKTRNEFGVLADDISKLADEIEKYTHEIVDLTTERERVSAELDLAAKIQDDMLPKEFPEHERFELFASMDPAKEVGGDFYDFFFIDDDHLALTIADVSGKGVPAALFMMMSKILIRNFAKSGLSPAEVLTQTNAEICSNNRNNMFVTVWFGILDLKTGHIVAANAGHEYPMIRKADGNFELFKDKHCFVIGGTKRAKYKQYEFDIEEGGTLFVYTDGAPEATNAEEKLFTTNRMIETLNRAPDVSPKELLDNMKSAIDEFVAGADQFDDLTMMSIRFCHVDESDEQKPEGEEE